MINKNTIKSSNKFISINQYSKIGKVDFTKSKKIEHVTHNFSYVSLLNLQLLQTGNLVHSSSSLYSCQKKTHYDQYLKFSSHHPLHQKLGVIRTLLERNDSVVTEEEDRKFEEDKIRKALSVCGYPEWTIHKVKKDRSRPKPNSSTSKYLAETEIIQTSCCHPLCGRTF